MNKNRKYQLLINSGNELGQQELFTVYVPDKTHINLADIYLTFSMLFSQNKLQALLGNSGCKQI